MQVKKLTDDDVFKDRVMLEFAYIRERFDHVVDALISIDRRVEILNRRVEMMDDHLGGRIGRLEERVDHLDDSVQRLDDRVQRLESEGE